MFGDALSGVPRFSPHFFFYMRSHYYYPQNERDVLRIYNYLGMIKDKVMSTDAYRRELIIHLLRYLYLELFNAYEKESMLVNTRKDTRKEELANKFFSLIMKHFKENKDVAFYADKLYFYFCPDWVRFPCIHGRSPAFRKLYLCRRSD